MSAPRKPWPVLRLVKPLARAPIDGNTAMADPPAALRRRRRRVLRLYVGGALVKIVGRQA